MRYSRSALKGAAIGTTTAALAFGAVSVALAGTQAGIGEAQQFSAPATATQSGVTAAQQSTSRSAPKTPTQQIRATSETPRRQAGISGTADPEPREVKEKDGIENDETRELSSTTPQQDVAAAPAPAPAAPVQQAPAPVQSYPVQQAPAPVQSYPVQQAPAPVPAPAQQAPAPAPAPGITIDLGGRGEVVPQPPIAPKQLHFG